MSEPKNGVCVVGSFMMDLTAYAPRHPAAGETLSGTSFVQSLGGKGFNQAVASRRAGAHTSIIGQVGDDTFGHAFVRMLGHENILTEGVTLNRTNGTGVGLLVVTPDGQNSIITVAQANSDVTPATILDHRNLIESAKVLLLQFELPIAAAQQAATIARNSGTTTILNPAPFRDIPKDLLECCDLIVPNEIELKQWLQEAPHSRIPLPDSARQLAEQTGTDVIVTLGSKGVLIARSVGEPDVVPGHDVEAVDTVGAGDTFCGHMAALIAQGANLRHATAQANAAAALAVTRPGSSKSAPTTDEVLAFIGSKSGEDHS